MTTTALLGGLTSTAFALAILAALDIWVFVDARANLRRRHPVVARIGPLQLETPQQWLLGCVALAVVILPAYFTARADRL